MTKRVLRLSSSFLTSTHSGASAAQASEPCARTTSTPALHPRGWTPHRPDAVVAVRACRPGSRGPLPAGFMGAAAWGLAVLPLGCVHQQEILVAHPPPPALSWLKPHVEPLVQKDHVSGGTTIQWDHVSGGTVCTAGPCIWRRDHVWDRSI